MNECKWGGFSCFLTKAVVFKGLRASFHADVFPVSWEQCINTLYLELRFCYGFIVGTFAKRLLHNRSLVWDTGLSIHSFVNGNVADD